MRIKERSSEEVKKTALSFDFTYTPRGYIMSAVRRTKG